MRTDLAWLKSSRPRVGPVARFLRQESRVVLGGDEKAVDQIKGGSAAEKLPQPVVEAELFRHPAQHPVVGHDHENTVI